MTQKKKSKHAATKGKESIDPILERLVNASCESSYAFVKELCNAIVDLPKAVGSQKEINEIFNRLVVAFVKAQVDSNKSAIYDTVCKLLDCNLLTKQN